MDKLGTKLHATLTVILAIAVVSLATYSVTLRSANRVQAQVLEARFNSIIGHLETEHELRLEIRNLKAKLGSAHGEPLGATHGGIWDTVIEGKNAVAIISGLLLLDKAENSADRHAKATAVFQSIADKTESRLVDLLAAHVATPNAATLQALLDHFLVK